MMIGLAIFFGALFALTFYVQSNYQESMKKITGGRPQDAVNLLLRVIGWQPAHVPALWQLAILNLSSDKPESAVRYLERILKLMDKESDKAAASARWELTEAQVLSKLAWCLSKLNKRTEAVAYFRRLIEWEPKNKEAIFELGRVLYTLREFDPCIQMFERVIQLDPFHGESYEMMSQALAAQGQNQRAADALERRLAKDRTNVALWIRLANLYRALKDNDKQADAWRTVREITPTTDPNHMSAIVQLGTIAFLENAFAESIDLLQEAATLCPKDDVRTMKSVRYYTGRALLELNRRTEAMSAFSDVYAMDHEYKDVRELLKNSLDILSDEDIVQEIQRMNIEEFSKIAIAVVKQLGYKTVSVDTVNDVDIKIHAKLEETGKDRGVMVYFQRAFDTDVGELSIRTFTLECEECHIEYPIYFTIGGFSFEALMRAKDYHVRLMPKRDFCEMIRKVKSAG